MNHYLRKRTPAFFLILWGILFLSSAALPGNGFKYFKNYTRLDYNNQAQNWAVSQDKRGIIYLANQGGLMEFDGVTWKLILVPNRIVRSMTIDDTSSNTMIYIGGNNEIGFVTSDLTGQLQYTSLRSKLPPNTPEFSDVSATIRLEKTIYFQTANLLITWNTATQKMGVSKIETVGKSIFLCNNRLYLYQLNKGLSILDRNGFKSIPGVPRFASAIRMIVPYNHNNHEEKILIGTASEGLFLYDGVTAVPFKTDIDESLKENEIFSGILLSSRRDEFALGTSKAGLMVIDSHGKLKYILDKSRELPENSICDVFEDIYGNLWLSLSNGLSKLEYGSSLYMLDGRNGLEGLGLSVVKHGGTLFTGTTEGLFYLSTDGNFRLIRGIVKECWSLLSTGDWLLAATSDGTYGIDSANNSISFKPQKILNTFTYVLTRSKATPNRIWAGTQQELTALIRETGRSPWKPENISIFIGQEIKSIVEDEQGNLWLGTRGKGVFKIDFKNRIFNPITLKVTHYTENQGLPPGGVNVAFIAKHVIFLTSAGLARFNEKENKFIPDHTLGSGFSILWGKTPVFRLVEDKDGNLWFHSRGRSYSARLKPGETYDIVSKPFSRIPLTQVSCIYNDSEDNSVWFASLDSLIHFNPKNNSRSTPNFKALIRKVELIKDKVGVFNGYQLDGNPKHILHRFEYKDRNIRFEFACPFFEDEKSTVYSVQLLGYDDDWSPFTSETQKDYTNLSAGTYTFRVKAKNVYGDISQEANYRFEVLPPWFQTWWAYLIYTVSLILLLRTIVRWRSRKLIKEKERLEKVIEIRTKEIQEKNIQLESQKDQLEIQSEQLKELDQAKSRFFANISHEFRTPLTLLIGPLEQILSTTLDKKLKSEAAMMLRNSNRLLNLVNQLLELARFDSGTMRLKASEFNGVLFVKNLVMCFESLAAHEKKALSFTSEEKSIPLYLDPDRFEKIISNLLVNAFNYTTEGEKISVTVRQAQTPTDRFHCGYMEVKVCDTGIGIPEPQLPYIFDRFFRIEGNYETKRKGSGIGLALTKEAVELHHGTIDVSSKCKTTETNDIDHGTQFTLRLPLGKAHLTANEIAEQKENSSTSRENNSMYFTPVLLLDSPEDLDSFENGDTSVPPEISGEIPGGTSLDASSTQSEERFCVLLIDDNGDVRNYIRSALSTHFHVEEARDGIEGIIRAKDLIPDLIVSDVMMPGTDGFDLCTTLKNDALTGHIPIILLTARSGQESELKGLQCGADDYINKPFNANVLTARVENLIRLRQNLQAERKNQLTLQPTQLPVSPLDDIFYKTLVETLENKLSDPELNVDTLARILNMSQPTLYRKIIGLTGITPVHFIRSYRLKRAAQLLETNKFTVAEVSTKTGFNSLPYFSKCFKEQFLIQPSEVFGTGSYSHLLPDDVVTDHQLNASFEKTEKLEGKAIILVVEDNIDARQYIHRSLETEYHVVEAEGGNEGIARAMEIIPDIIISDIMMPGTDGLQLCEMLKNDVRTSHIPILLLTARATEESIIQGLKTGADDYVTKPFNMELLKARIANLIHLRQSHHQNRRNELALIPTGINETKVEKEFLGDLQKVMKAFHTDPDFSVEQLAEKLYISPASLYRKIKALTGESPADYLKSYRLNRAARLFKSNFGTVTEVAFEVGFKNRTHFTRSFKEKFHCLPSSFLSTEINNRNE